MHYMSCNNSYYLLAPITGYVFYLHLIMPCLTSINLSSNTTNNQFPLGNQTMGVKIYLQPQHITQGGGKDPVICVGPWGVPALPPHSLALVTLYQHSCTPHPSHVSAWHCTYSHSHSPSCQCTCTLTTRLCVHEHACPLCLGPTPHPMPMYDPRSHYSVLTHVSTPLPPGHVCSYMYDRLSPHSLTVAVALGTTLPWPPMNAHACASLPSPPSPALAHAYPHCLALFCYSIVATSGAYASQPYVIMS